MAESLRSVSDKSITINRSMQFKSIISILVGNYWRQYVVQKERLVNDHKLNHCNQNQN